jgi:hypothetical protein
MQAAVVFKPASIQGNDRRESFVFILEVETIRKYNDIAGKINRGGS